MPTSEKADPTPDLRHLSHDVDPITSDIAAEKHDRNGKRATHKAICYLAVCKQPGRTSAEIAAAIDLDRHEAARRLADLRNDGTVTQGERRRCGVCGNLSVTWWVPEPRQGRLF